MHVAERTFDQQRDPSIYDEFFFFPEHKLSITPQNKNVVSKRSSKKSIFRKYYAPHIVNGVSLSAYSPE